MVRSTEEFSFDDIPRQPVRTRYEALKLNRWVPDPQRAEEERDYLLSLVQLLNKQG